MKLGDTGLKVKEWQEFLIESTNSKLILSGIFDSSTEKATKKFQKSAGLTPDGIVGPKTLRATKTNNLGPVNFWPRQTYEDMCIFYGPVGENQTSLILPYTLKLAWDHNTEIRKLTCHKKVAESLYNIFERALKAYGKAEIKKLRLDIFGGCLNVRKMRGGSSWSIHSWGAAVDLDPDNNQLRWGQDKATFARKEYNEFWKIVENQGWTSLGRTKNYDWMHFQAANL